MALIRKVTYAIECDFCHNNRPFWQAPKTAIEDAEYHLWQVSPDGRARCDQCPPMSERFIDFATALKSEDPR